MSKIIGIFSGKGGVGKTTTVVNIAIALEEFGKRVCIIEGNIASSNLGLHLGVADHRKTVHNVLKKKINVTEAITIHPSKIHYIPGSLSIKDSISVNIKNLKKHLEKLKNNYEFVIVDGPPGLDPTVIKLIKFCDEIIVVTNPEITAVADATKIIEVAKRFRIGVKGLVVNKVKSKDYELSIEEIESTVGMPVISIIPDDKAIPKSISLGTPIVLYQPNSLASLAFRKFASSIAGVAYEKRAGIIERIKSFIFRY